MDQVPVGHAAVDSGVLAHWGDDDAVDELKLANLQRAEQGTHHISFQSTPITTAVVPRDRLDTRPADNLHVRWPMSRWWIPHGLSASHDRERRAATPPGGRKLSESSSESRLP